MRARGTRDRRDSRICLPVSVFRLSFFPAIERFLMSLPEILNAAYELPPKAMKTARVDITFAYVRRRRSLSSTRSPFARVLGSERPGPMP